MSTATETAKLVTIGMRFRASYLVQQAGYTLGIASAEGEALAALLPTGHLDKTAQLRDEKNRASAWFVHLLKTNEIYITNVRLQNRPGQSQSEAEMQFNNYCIGWKG